MAERVVQYAHPYGLAQGSLARCSLTRRSLARALAATLCILLVACGGGDEQAEDTEPARDVVALGRVEPVSRVLDLGAPLNARVSKLLVTEGQDVEAGAVLCYLDDYEEAKADRDRVVAEIADAERRHLAVTRLGQSSGQEAGAELERSRTTGPLRLEAQQASLRAAESELASATKEFERGLSLNKDGISSEGDLDVLRLRLANAEERASELRAGLAALESEVSQQLLVSEARLALSRDRTARDLASIPLASLRAQLGQASARLERAQIVAPIKGRILKILTRPGEAVGGKPVLQMGDVSSMFVVAEIYETDVDRVREGQKAIVTSPVFSEPQEGTVDEVGLLIYRNDVLDVNPASNIDARVVEVRVRLNDPEAVASLSNLQVDVRIETADREQ